MRFRLNGFRVFVAWDAWIVPAVYAITGLVEGDVSHVAFAPVWLGVLLLHEWGHAAMVRLYGGTVVGLDLHAFHGLCAYTGAHLTAEQRVRIAWGGVLAQAAVGLPVWWLLSGTSYGRFGDTIVAGFGGYNLMVAALNLLPVEPLDGATAWKILRR